MTRPQDLPPPDAWCGACGHADNLVEHTGIVPVRDGVPVDFTA